MKQYLAREFTEEKWYPKYRKIKKALRSKKIPFTIRKLSSSGGMVHGIWTTSEYIDQARDIVCEHYLQDPKIRNQILRTEALAQEFEDKWIKNIFFTLIVKVINHPVIFIATAVAVIAMVVYPYFQYR